MTAKRQSPPVDGAALATMHKKLAAFLPEESIEPLIREAGVIIANAGNVGVFRVHRSLRGEGIVDTEESVSGNMHRVGELLIDRERAVRNSTMCDAFRRLILSIMHIDESSGSWHYLGSDQRLDYLGTQVAQEKFNTIASILQEGFGLDKAASPHIGR